MTATTPPPARVARKGARSLKVRGAPPVDDQAALGSFPAPTAISEQLVADNLKLAFSRANRYASRTRMPLDDLEAAAYVGLVNGARRFDPARGWAFSTCAVRFIDGAILRYLRDKGHAIKFPVRWREHGPRVRKLVEQGAGIEQIQTETGMDADEVRIFILATSPTTEIDPNLIGEVDPLDMIEEDLPEAQDVLAVLDQALGKMHPADLKLLSAYWEDSARNAYPMRQLQALDRCVRNVVGPNQLRRPTATTALGFEVEVGAVVKQQGPLKAKRSREELAQKAEQLGLIDLLSEN